MALQSSSESVTFLVGKTFLDQGNDLANYLKNLTPTSSAWDEVEAFFQGTYVQTAHLLNAVEKHKGELLCGAIEALSMKGFAPSEKQREIIAQAFEVFKIMSL